MRKIAYIAAEVVALYCVTVALMLGFLYFTTGFGLVGTCLTVLSMIAAIPFAIRGATIGFRNEHSLGSAVGFGFYRPIRLIALVMPAVWAAQAESDNAVFGHRQKIHFQLGGGDSSRAYDAISALAAHLEEQGVPHTNVGGLTVRDNGVKWWLEPVTGENAVQGWVESPNVENRRQVIDGIADFLFGPDRSVAA